MGERKTRADAFEKRLNDVQFMELRDGLLADWTYESAQAWLAVNCGLSVSLGALNRFYRSECQPVLQKRRRFAALKSEIVAREAKDNPVDWEAVILEKMEQLTFEFLMEDRGALDTKAAARFMNLLLRNKALELGKEKLTAESKAKIDAGLDAMFEEVKGNPAAEKHFQALREAVKAA